MLMFGPSTASSLIRAARESRYSEDRLLSMFSGLGRFTNSLDEENGDCEDNPKTLDLSL